MIFNILFGLQSFIIGIIIYHVIYMRKRINVLETLAFILIRKDEEREEREKGVIK